MKKNLSLRTKVILSVVVVIAFFGCLAALSVFSTAQQNLTLIKTQDLIELSNAHSHKIKQSFVSSQKVVETIAAQPDIRFFLSADEDEQVVLFDQFQVLLKRYNINNDYSAIYVLNQKGETLLSTDESFLNKNYSFRPYFQHAMSGQAYLDTAIGITSKELGYYFSYPVYSSDNQDTIVGVVVAKLGPEAVNSVIIDGLSAESVENVDQEDVLLVDSYGVVLFSLQPERKFQTIGTLTVDERADIEQVKRYQGIKIESLGYEVVKENIYDYQNAVAIMVPVEKSEPSKIITLSKIDDFPFYLLLQKSSTSVTRPAYQTASVIALFVSLAASIAAIVIWLLMTKLLYPITDLQNMTRDIAQGDFDSTQVLHTGDEFEIFSIALHSMAKKIKHSQAELQSEIERTTKQLRKKIKELEKINQAMVGREVKMAEMKKEIEQFQQKESNDSHDK